MKIKTNASHAEELINKMMKEQTNMPTEWHYLDGSIQTVLLETTLDEVAIYFGAAPFLRPGYETKSDQTTFPTLFAKINGKTDYGQHYDKKNLDHIVYLHDQTLWDFQKNFKVDLPSDLLDDGLLDPREAYKLFDKKLTGLKLPLQDHFLRTLNRLLQDYHDIILDKYCDINQTDLLRSILSINKKYLFLLNSVDMSYLLPKLIIGLKKKTLNVEHAIGLLFLNLLGYDIIVIHEANLTDIENYIHSSYLNTYNISDIGTNNKVTKRKFF